MDTSFLKYLDVLIGLSVVMLTVTTAIMAANQLYLNSAYVRARCLRDGLIELIRMLDGTHLERDAKYIADRILRYPLAGRASSPFGLATGWARNQIRGMQGKPPLPPVNPSTVIEREELCLILLEWAAGEGPIESQNRELIASGGREYLDALQVRVRDSVARLGIADPGTTLKQLRLRAMENETSEPGASAFRWRSGALTAVAPVDYTARIFAWFDNSMRRVADTFSLHAKVSGSMLALFFTMWLQLDVIEIMKWLSYDSTYRTYLVEQAKGIAGKESLEAAQKELEQGGGVVGGKQGETGQKKGELAAGATGGKQGETGQQKGEQAAGEASGKALAELQRVVEEVPVFGVNFSPDESKWWFKPELRSANGWPALNPTVEFGKHMPGALLAWVLLSLGAPFWFDMVKKLFGLRSILAQKETTDAEVRSQDQTGAAAGGTTGGDGAGSKKSELATSEASVQVITHPTPVRAGKPSPQSPVVEVLEEDTLFVVKGTIQGEAAVAGDPSSTIWFVTPEGNFLHLMDRVDG